MNFYDFKKLYRSLTSFYSKKPKKLIKTPKISKIDKKPQIFKT